MKALSSKVPKTLEVGSELVCADNTGARILEVVGIKGGRTSKPGRAKCGVGDHVIVRIKKGEHEMKGEMYDAVVIRQRKEIQRASGMNTMFEDNAAVLIEPTTEMPKGNRIKGVVAKEAVERYQSVGKIASMVV